MPQMRRYLIERDIPGVGGMSIVELCGAARASNRAIEQIGDGIQWQHSYVAGDKIYCVHETDDADTVREHARRGGFPADVVVEVAATFGPETANS